MLCLNCAKKLRPLMTRRGLTIRENRLKKLIEGHPQAKLWREELERLPGEYQRDKDRHGYDGQGHFCRGMCAQAFAETLARTGVKLAPDQVARNRAWRERLSVSRAANSGVAPI